MKNLVALKLFIYQLLKKENLLSERERERERERVDVKCFGGSSELTGRASTQS